MEFIQQFACPGPPWDFFTDLLDDLCAQRVHDVTGFEPDARGLQDGCRVKQGLSHQLHCLLVGPCAAVGFHQRALRSDPVGFRVHECAIHIPEHGFEEGLAG